MIKKLMTLFFGVALIALPATVLISTTAHASCYDPEFDAVGLDTANVFVDNVLAQIVANDFALESSSNFAGYTSGWLFNPSITINGTSFPTAVEPGIAGLLPFGTLATAGGPHCINSAGAPVSCQPAEFFIASNTNTTPVHDPCFNWPAQVNDAGISCHFPYNSIYTPERDGGIYRWRIVLQKKPTSDIDINIEDCVLTETLNCPTGIFTSPSETGFYNLGPYLVFLQTALPSITAYALPGPYASMGFNAPMLLYTRQQPQTSATLYPINELPFVSKALFDESIVIAMPMTGGSVYGNFANGYTLTGGDMIDISVGIPETINPNDYYFGADNVFLKYIGMTGTGVYGGSGCTP